MTSRLVIAVLAVLTLLGTTTSCGKKRSDDVTFTLNPSRPVIIEAGFKFPDDTATTDIDESLTVTGPWYKYRFSIKNNASDTVTIVSIESEIKGYKNGATVTGTSSHASDIEATPYLAIAATGAEATSPFTFYSDGLPKADGLRYTVRMRVLGWFGSYDDPKERFEKVITFVTQ
ncbi:MAG: hypothetical protein V4692_04860 [Bdellovibrionota bacterium]